MKNNDKHAFLIMAHHEFNLLKVLLSLLDHERVDIYLHIDKKAKAVPYDELSKTVKKSTLVFVKSVSVSWGGSTQVLCELNLLQAAIRKKYMYYHLISGVDLPLMPIEGILDFFDNKEIQYIGFDHSMSESGKHMERVQFFWLFQNSIGKYVGGAAEIIQKRSKYIIKNSETF